MARFLRVQYDILLSGGPIPLREVETFEARVLWSRKEFQLHDGVNGTDKVSQPLAYDTMRGLQANFFLTSLYSDSDQTRLEVDTCTSNARAHNRYLS